MKTNKIVVFSATDELLEWRMQDYITKRGHLKSVPNGQDYCDAIYLNFGKYLKDNQLRLIFSDMATGVKKIDTNSNHLRKLFVEDIQDLCYSNKEYIMNVYYNKESVEIYKKGSALNKIVNSPAIEFDGLSLKISGEFLGIMSILWEIIKF